MFELKNRDYNCKLYKINDEIFQLKKIRKHKLYEKIEECKFHFSLSFSKAKIPKINFL